MPARSTTLRSLALAAACTASAAGLVGLAAPAGATTSAASAYLSNLNRERAAHGLPALTLRSDLTAIAQRWSNHMAAAHVLAHNPGLARQVTNWQVVGENVGEGPSISALTTAFWNSPEHRSNILDRSYRDVGIGTATSNGVIWITIDFRDPMHAERTVPRRTTSHPTLHIGSRGRAVARVQRKLHVAADGIFGPITRRAVERFQRRHHLRANGVVAARTWRALHL
jgi:peptidoglycan hydrolase-like protein with peptidoglycan-binding domain